MMNVTRSLGIRLLAAFLVVCLQGMLLPTSFAASPGALTGTVFSMTRTNTLSGVIVHVASLDDNRIFSSAPTTDDGAFIVEDLPAGSYEIAIESSGVLYTVRAPVQIGAGHTRQLRLNLDGQVDASQGVPSAQLRSIWNNPLTAALIVVGAVAVIGIIADSSTSDDEGDSSPF